MSGRRAGNPFGAVKVHPLASARIDFPQNAIAVLYSELLDWVSKVKENLKGIFVVHGEEQSALSFADALRAMGRFQVTVPEPNQSIEL